jgi:hypothetical protein
LLDNYFFDKNDSEPISKRSLLYNLCVMWYIPHGGAHILILEIFNILLRLKFSPSLTLNKIKRFETGSKKIFQVATKTRKHKEENCVNLFLGALVPLWQK